MVSQRTGELAAPDLIEPLAGPIRGPRDTVVVVSHPPR